MSEEMEAEGVEGEEGEEEEMVLFSFQRVADGQRKGKTKQNKKSESAESQEGSEMEGCWSAHFLCMLSAAASRKSVAWDSGLWV